VDIYSLGLRAVRGEPPLERTGWLELIPGAEAKVLRKDPSEAPRGKVFTRCESILSLTEDKDPQTDGTGKIVL